MKKCSRCEHKLVWDKTYCPLCGAPAVDAPEVASVEAAQPREEPVRKPPEEESVLQPAPQPPIQPAQPTPPRPEASDAREKLPNLDYLAEADDEADENAAEQAAYRLPSLDLGEGVGGSSFGGIERGSGGAAAAGNANAQENLTFDVSDHSAYSGASFERFNEQKSAAPKPEPQNPAAPDASKSKKDNESKNDDSPQGEFLKMFPDARPD